MHTVSITQLLTVRCDLVYLSVMTVTIIVNAGIFGLQYFLLT